MKPHFARSALAFLLLAAGTSGCRFVTVGPLGIDATVSGSWTVMGGAAGAASCNTIGVDEVRLAIIDGGIVYYDDLLTAPCSAGLLDTRPTEVLNAGTYTARWEGYRGGTRVATGPERTIVATVGGHVMMTPIDFVSGGFDPIGTDASVEAHWTVERMPPTAGNCAALGIDRVRIAFFDGGMAREYTALSAACAGGSFDTRPSRVLRAGTYTVQFQAVDRSGTVLGAGAMTTITATAGGHVNLYDGAPVDFSSGGFDPMGSDATLRTAWTLNDGPANVGTCFAVGIDQVRILFHPPTDTDFNEGVVVATAACSVGLIDSRPMTVLRAGSYLASVEAVDDTGALVAEFMPTITPFTVTAGSDVNVTGTNFVFPMTLTIGLDWQRGLGGPPGTCADAGVEVMNYTLTNEATGTPIFSRTAVPCGELVSFEAGITPGFGAGRYRLYFDGDDSFGVKHWIVGSGMCTGIVVDNTNSIVYDQCLGEWRP
jgi:hypothetical protein